VPRIDPEAISHAAELQSLRDQLDRAMRQVKASESELARVNAQSASDRERLNRELRTLKQDNTVLVDKAKLLTQRNDDTASELKRVQADLRKLTAEKRGWQEQLDTMHHKVVQAERQVRCLDHLTRGKLEAREGSIFGLTKRTKLAMTQRQPGSEVVKAFSDLNEEILQAANLLVENLDRTHYYLSTTELSSKAEKVVGTHVTQMLKTQSSSKTSGFQQLLMTVVLEVFFVHWCSAIIEGHYPKRTTFADLLVELSQTQTVTTTGKLRTYSSSCLVFLTL
jgi:FtsZ-binding cell division protein ZapB